MKFIKINFINPIDGEEEEAVINIAHIVLCRPYERNGKIYVRYYLDFKIDPFMGNRLDSTTLWQNLKVEK